MQKECCMLRCAMRTLNLVVASLLALSSCCYGNLEFVFHNHTAVEAYLRGVTRRYPHLADIYSIGKSVQGRDLWVMALGASPREHVLLRPEVKYVANIHGNEVTGREILLHFIERLVTEYNINTTITHLLNTMRVHMLVSINPDGFENATNHRGEGNCTGGHGRANANGYDLNRNFPDFFESNRIVDYQPEARALMAWVKNHQFVISGQLHDGALVANYPYDSYGGALIDNRAKYSRAPDDDVFRHLSWTYSTSHTLMHRGDPCWGQDEEGFPNGMTNGAFWYPVVGGMQDYNYIFAGCMELTLELSCCKYSYRTELLSKWRENKEALVNLLLQGHRGVKGIVRTPTGRPVHLARVSVRGRQPHYLNTTRLGEYWRVLLPGNYTLQVVKEGYEPAFQDVTVVEGKTAILNFTLVPEYEYRFISAAPPTGLISIVTVFLSLGLLAILSS